MNRFASRLAGVTIVVVGLAGTALMPLVAQAETIRSTCTKDGCFRDCEQHQADGTTIYYEHGTEILVVTADGKEHKFRCNNGNWEPAAKVRPTTLSGPSLTNTQKVAR